jgi:alkylhydroperoxidase family enzyme
MTQFTIHTTDTAPEASRPALERLTGALGFLPNLVGTIAASPTLVEGLAGLFGPIHAGRFSEPEIQVVLLTDAVANRAPYAVAFHSALGREAGLGADTIAALRDGRPPAEARFAALSALARGLIETRGHLDDAGKQGFLAAGFTPADMLEVVAIVAASTITNTAANLAAVPLDARFEAERWTAPVG